jgi:mutator protein MutT
MIRNRAVAIVIDNNQLLVIYREQDGKKYYTFPGGGIELGETPKQATTREIDEEASIKISVGKLLYKGRYDNGDIHYFYSCKYLSGTPKLRVNTNEFTSDSLSGSIHKPMWLNLSDIPNVVLYPIEIRNRLLYDLKTQFTDKTTTIKLTAD